MRCMGSLSPEAWATASQSGYRGFLVSATEDKATSIETTTSPTNHETTDGQKQPVPTDVGQRPPSDSAAVAYLTSRYPAVSHTFVLREVEALRDLGVRVETVSMHRSDPSHVLSARDREAFRTTFAVLPASPWTLIRSHLRVARKAPARYLRALRRAQQLRRPGLRGAIWAFFYLTEAVIVWSECDRRKVRHLHAQFASAATDVALLAAELGGRARDGNGTWSWSLAVHGSAEFCDVTMYRLADKLRDADLAVAISDFGRSQLMGLVAESEWDKLHVVRSGVDPNEYAPQHRDEPEGGPLQILTVGRMIPVKGQAVLIDALAELSDWGFDAQVTFIGDGPSRESLEARARERGVDGSVTFAGTVGQDDIRAFYAGADVFCSSSFAEGLPVVLMEAMAMERPVVATRIMGVPELVEDGESGLLVSPGRPDALASALAKLAGDAALRKTLGVQARDAVTANFDVRKSARRLQGLFASTTPRSPVGRRGAGRLT